MTSRLFTVPVRAGVHVDWNVVLSRRNFLIAAALPAFAQETKFSTDVSVVTLLANVRDKDGRYVKDLAKEDFVLKQDGATQAIRYFSRESNLPLTIGLLVDTSHSQTEVLEPERNASEAFLTHMLREGTDQAFVVSFDTEVHTVQGPTSSRADLEAGLGQLRIPGQLGTLLFSAVRDASEKVMRKEKGRKAFIILSDGNEFRDPVSIVTAIEFAQRSDTIVYSIRFADRIKPYRPGRAAVQSLLAQRGKSALHRLSEETGGTAYEVSKNQSIEEIYRKIEEDLRNQYSLGFTPSTAADGKFHKIALTTKRRGLTVQTRSGYYAK